jgi:DDE domain
MDGRRRAGVGGQNCDGALLTARPLSGHAHPVRRQQAPPKPGPTDQSQGIHASCVAGQTMARDGTPVILTFRSRPGWYTPILTVASVEYKIRQAWSMRRCPHRVPVARSSFAGFRFPPDVITLAVRWYLRYGLSYRDVEELLTERGITVDHVTVFRWVQRFTPLLIDAARPCRHAPGDRWFVDETYAKIAGRWIYLYRAIDQFGQVIDVLVSRSETWRPPVDSSPAPLITRRPRSRSPLIVPPPTRGCSMSWCLPPVMSPSNTERMKLSTHLHSWEVGFVLELIPFGWRQRFETSVRSRGQGGACTVPKFITCRVSWVFSNSS